MQTTADIISAGAAWSAGWTTHVRESVLSAGHRWTSSCPSGRWTRYDTFECYTSLIDSLVDPLIDPLVDWLIDPLVDCYWVSWSIDEECPVCRTPVNKLVPATKMDEVRNVWVLHFIDRSVDWSVGWSIGWLIDWLVGCYRVDCLSDGEYPLCRTPVEKLVPAEKMDDVWYLWVLYQVVIFINRSVDWSVGCMIDRLVRSSSGWLIDGFDWLLMVYCWLIADWLMVWFVQELGSQSVQNLKPVKWMTAVT